MSCEIFSPWVNSVPLFCYHLHALGKYFISYSIAILLGLVRELSELGYIYIQMTSHDSFFKRFFDSTK